MVEWLERHYCDRHGRGLKPIPVILLCPWEGHSRHFPLLVNLGKQS